MHAPHVTKFCKKHNEELYYSPDTERVGCFICHGEWLKEERRRIEEKIKTKGGRGVNMTYKIKRPLPPYYIPLSDKIERQLDNEWKRGRKGKEEMENLMFKSKGKGWYEEKDLSLGKAPKHSEVAARARYRGTLRIPTKKSAFSTRKLPKNIDAQIQRYYRKFEKEAYKKYPGLQMDIRIGQTKHLAVNQAQIEAGRRLFKCFIDNKMWHWGGKTYKVILKDGTPLLYPAKVIPTYEMAYLGNMYNIWRTK